MSAKFITLAGVPIVLSPTLITLASLPIVLSADVLVIAELATVIAPSATVKKSPKGDENDDETKSIAQRCG